MSQSNEAATKFFMACGSLLWIFSSVNEKAEFLTNEFRIYGNDRISLMKSVYEINVEHLDTKTKPWIILHVTFVMMQLAQIIICHRRSVNLNHPLEEDYGCRRQYIDAKMHQFHKKITSLPKDAIE